MKVSVFGSGYVGLVTGALLADVGNEVLCVDIDAEKVARLNDGDVPIHEPKLEDYIRANLALGRLRFSTDAAAAVQHGEVIFIAVGTPADEDGSADVRHVAAVADSIGALIDAPRIIVNKSTVPVGTAELVRERIQSALVARGVAIAFSVVSNPEFLKEGEAVDDFNKPDRIIIGVDEPAAEQRMRELYAPFSRNHDRILSMDLRSAELSKYAANAMLATKISFMNELSNLADRLGADIEQVRLGIGADARIGYNFIYPGIGYGGSCFPKDVKALIATAEQNGYSPALLRAVEAVNQAQKRVLLDKIEAHFGADLSGRQFALWGLAFKPKTDDMREAPSRVMMEALWARGAVIRAYDPVAMNEARRLYPDKLEQLQLAGTAMDALQGAEALIINTEWREFRSPDWPAVRAALGRALVFDGRNMYEPQALAGHGLQYHCVGRPALTPAGD